MGYSNFDLTSKNSCIMLLRYHKYNAINIYINVINAPDAFTIQYNAR